MQVCFICFASLNFNILPAAPIMLHFAITEAQPDAAIAENALALILGMFLI